MACSGSSGSNVLTSTPHLPGNRMTFTDQVFWRDRSLSEVTNMKSSILEAGTSPGQLSYHCHVPGTQFMESRNTEQLSFIFQVLLCGDSYYSRLILLVSLSLILGARKMVLLSVSLMIGPFRMLLAERSSFPTPILSNMIYYYET